jgi:prepilin-type N-terminal cleavage/methylation domain-containing protein
MMLQGHATNQRRGLDAPPSAKRDGFTLIELLVVIAIIGILVALTAAAVFQAGRQASTVETRNEISQFDNALSAARLALGVDYLPSRIRLRKDMAYTNDPVDVATRTALEKAFGRRMTPPIQWNGGAGDGPWDLGPDQTLVFWLGGIPDPTNNGSVGFSNNPSNPAQAGGTRKGPFFEFKANRLIRSANGFFVYTDAFGTRAPYLYFSSGRAGNDYVPSEAAGLVYPTGHALAGQAINISPYMEGTRFLNATGHQILSAGRDGRFGPGGSGNWTASGGSTQNETKDDLANFSRSVLGAPQN